MGIRTLLLAVVVLSRVTGATPLYFEERSGGLFETRGVRIRADRIEVDGVTLRFDRSSRKARLEGLGAPAPSTYITRGLTRTFRQYPKVAIRQLCPGIDLVFTKYFGGGGSDFGGPVATDTQGSVCVTGSTTRLQPPLLALSNAGQTVTPLPVGTQVSVTAIAGTADGNVLYVATPSGIFVSGNHGASFAQAAPLDPPGTVNAISVDPIDPSRAMAATTSGLFTMNGAGQLAGRNDAGMAVAGNGMVNAASVQISAVDHLVAYATTATPNYLYKTTNADSAWQQLNPAYPGEPSAGPLPGTSIKFTLTPGGSDLYVIDGNGILLKSTDGGVTWQRLAGQLFGAKSITIDPNNPSSIYAVDNFGVQRSTNGGAAFTTISPPLPGGLYVQAFALDSSTGNLYFATFTQIEGAAWKSLPSRPNPHMLLGLGSQDGSVSAPPLPVPVALVSVFIGVNAVVPQFVAAADGIVAGITQVNAQVPVASYSSTVVNVFVGGAVGQVYIQ